jgi:hypothetical protein
MDYTNYLLPVVWTKPILSSMFKFPLVLIQEEGCTFGYNVAIRVDTFNEVPFQLVTFVQPAHLDRDGKACDHSCRLDIHIPPSDLAFIDNLYELGLPTADIRGRELYFHGTSPSLISAPVSPPVSRICLLSPLLLLSPAPISILSPLSSIQVFKRARLGDWPSCTA